MPRVSVVIPAYNAARFIGETIASVLAQSFDDFELIVTDSASSDGTADIVQGHDDPRIRLTDLPFVCEAAIKRNLGLARAQGDYVAFIDADDIMMPDRLARQVAFLDANPAIHVVGSSYVTFEEGQPDKPVIQPAADAIIKANFLTVTGNGIHSPTAMLRRDMQTAQGLFFQAVRAGEGQIFWKDWMLAGARFANIEEPLLRYRRHADSHVSQRREEFRPARTLLREELLTLFYPHLSRAEARIVSQMMERGREHEISELASGVTLVEKIADYRTCGFGADRVQLLRILGQAHGEAKAKMKRVLAKASALA